MVKANLKDKWPIQLTSSTVYCMCGFIIGFVIIIVMSFTGTETSRDAAVILARKQASGFVENLMRFVFIGAGFCVMIHYKHKTSSDEWLYF